MGAACRVSWEEGVETDDPNLLVISSVRLPSWVSSLGFSFCPNRVCVWWSVVDFPLLGFVVLLIM